MILFHHALVMNQNIRSIKQQITPVLKRNNVVRSSLFGSFARGEATEESDFDVLVELPRGKSLFDFVGLKLELEKTLNKKVDLLTYASLSPKLKKIIEREHIPVYES